MGYLANDPDNGLDLGEWMERNPDEPCELCPHIAVDHLGDGPANECEFQPRDMGEEW